MCDEVSDFQTHLLAPESKGVLKTHTQPCECVKGTWKPTLKGQSWNSLSKNIDTVLLGYDTKYKININEFILIQKMIEQINMWGRINKSPVQKNSKQFMQILHPENKI